MDKELNVGKITQEKLEEAQQTIFIWFMEQNAQEPKKPITMLDTTIKYEEEQFRIITHLSFYGRDETIFLNKQNKKEGEKL